ncbi:SUKH-4 family immunity protein [Micromonospora sp. NPDC003944]
MNPDLRELIEELRVDLAADEDRTVSWGKISAGAPADKIPAEIPQPVRELMEVAESIAAGAFYLPGISSSASFQTGLPMMPDFTGVAAEPDQWYEFGRLKEEPLLLRRDSGAVWYFPEISTDEWFAREAFEQIAPDLDSFLAYYVFGAGYAEIGYDDDDWWRFLEEQDLTTPGEQEDE